MESTGLPRLILKFDIGSTLSNLNNINSIRLSNLCDYLTESHSYSSEENTQIKIIRLSQPKGIPPEVSEFREALQESFLKSISENKPYEITDRDRLFLNQVITMHTRCPECARAYISEYNHCNKGKKYIDRAFELKLKN